jgi:DNA-binding transcriptional LysR family regulator
MEHMVDQTETISGSLDDIRAFCAVMALGSISAAARQMETTKGGLSRRVSRLERRLGVKLLARTPRAVSPTEEGADFYNKAREALALLGDAAESARKSDVVPSGHLRVTAPVDFGVDVLPPLLVQFHAQHPQITVELIVTDTLLDLAAHRIDLAFRATERELPDMNYRASLVTEFSIALYAAKAYLVANGTPSVPADLATHEFVMTREPAGAVRLVLTNKRGSREAVLVQPVIISSDFSSVARLVLAGGGIGAIPEIVASSHVASGALVRVLSEWRVAQASLHAISLAGLNAPARVRAFREFIRRQLSARTILRA